MNLCFTPRTAGLHSWVVGALAAPVLAVVLALPTPASAQLSSPMGEGATVAPQGSGAGFHSPNSPIAPLVERNDVLPWSLLTAVKTKTEKNRILPVFASNVLALNQKSQRLQGFMMPLDPGEKQKHFLISSVPLSCSFCLPGGPESLVEVRTKTPVKYSLEPVVVEGKFSVLADDPYGMYYRMSDAVAVK
ncbi:MAG: DUF3299 domain-containing protein [Rhodoferax sp.]|nr:DUF3299 domain-containing protein [Rhodoferax sp.]